MSFFGNTDFLIEVGKGNVSGHSLENIFGRNPSVGTLEEDVWDAGAVLIYPTSGEQWEVVSSSSNDDLADTGATKVSIRYLDDLFIEQTETVDMNGQIPVLMSATNIYRFIGARVIETGSSKENEGNITVRVAGSGNTRGQINAGENEALDGHFTIPAGKTGYLIAWYCEAEKGEDLNMRIRRTDGENGIFRTIGTLSVYQNNIVAPFNGPSDPISEKSDILIKAISSNIDVSASVIMQILLVDN